MTIHSFRNSIDKAVQDLLQGPTNPDKEFIRGGATFGQVYSMASGLHNALTDLQQPRAIICLAVEDKAIMAAALLASLAGGPTLLLPYAFSANALLQLQQTTGFTTAIADATREFPEGVKVLGPESATVTDSPIPSQAYPQAELLKIFTGGSTGTPQVWSKTGANLFGEGIFLAKRFAVSEDDCILATIPPYHIYGLLFSVILPLVSSATVISATPSFPNEIDFIAEMHKVSILASVPVHYRILRDRKMSLRLAFSSAGMLDIEDNSLFSLENSNGIVEVYGSTETGGIATRNRSLGEEFFTPFATINWKITDSRLAVHSPFISPELPVDDAGFFTTSDRVEARGTKQFALQGRTDTVTKVGGKRVDLQEISLLIKQEQGVTDCVVMALPEAGGREHCIGVVIQGDAANTKTIKQKLANSLEPYAQPRRIIKVKGIPTTNNGKYDWTAIVQLLEK